MEKEMEDQYADAVLAACEYLMAKHGYEKCQTLFSDLDACLAEHEQDRKAALSQPQGAQQ